MRRFASVFASKRDKQPPPPLVTDQGHSSASSSSGSASLYLHTPEDDQHHLDVVDRRSSKRSWKSWLKPPTKPKPPPKDWQNPIPIVPDWTPHELDDTHSEPSLEDDQAPLTPQNPREPFETLVKNSLVSPPTPPSPFTHRSDAPLLFPRSVNLTSTLRRPHSLASTLFKTRILARLQSDDRPLTQAEQRSIIPMASRRMSPVVSLAPPPHPFNESAPSRTTVITFSSPGLSRWIARPCFEDRYAVFLPQQDGSISRQHVVGTALAVAALEHSEALEAMVDFELHEVTPSLVIEIPPPGSETTSASPPSSGPARGSPYIAVPSPLRNEHNLPAPLPEAMASPAVPVVAHASAADTLVKRGVRFAEDDKDDVIPIGYVLRMKKRREEKAKFLRDEQERRLLVEERMRVEEERLRLDAERAGWENERRAWEEEKRKMDEEKRQRKYTEEVIATRLRRESQRVGGVPAFKLEDNGLLGSRGSAGGYFPTSVTSSTSERNKAPPARRQSRAVYNDSGTPVHYPRREASEPNIPTISTLSVPPIVKAHSYHRSSSDSHSPGSSRPPSVHTPTSVESLPPLPGTRSPSVHSSQETPSSSEDVKAAVAAAARRTKRHSSMSHNNSSSSLGGDRGTLYPAWTGSNHSLNNNMVPPVPPVPMIPMQMQMQMMPVPAFVMMDMPLLPPTPPFMMQQYPRQHGSPSSSKGRLSGSQNSSREKVNVVNGSSGGAEGSRSGSSQWNARPEYRHTSSPPTTGSLHKSPQSGGDPRRASMPTPTPRLQHQSQSSRPRQYSHNDQRPPPPLHSHSQPSSLSRAGASSRYLEPPSPWTGVPTQSGTLPNANAMPPRQHSHSSLRTGTTPAKAKRQTVIS